MIGLVLLVEGLIGTHTLDLMTSEQLGWWMAGRAASHQARHSQVLCLGTSMAGLGIVPRLIEQRTGLAGYNLAICAGQSPAQYYLLRRALKAGAKPSVVMVDLNPCFLALDYRYAGNADVWPFLLGPWDCLDMAWTVGDPAFLARTLLATGIPSARFRHQLRAAALAALEGRAWSRRRDSLLGIRNLNQNRGAGLFPRNPKYGGEIASGYEYAYIQCDGEWDRGNLEFLHRMIGLCKENQIRIHGVLMPMAPALLNRRRELGLDAAFVRRVRRLQDAAPSLVVLDARGLSYQPSAFWDAVHLSVEGALVLSDDLGKLLASSGAAGRQALWIDLRRFQSRGIDCPVEELGSSAVALGPDSAARR
jgi:hypothetical protein